MNYKEILEDVVAAYNSHKRITKLDHPELKIDESKYPSQFSETEYEFVVRVYAESKDGPKKSYYQYSSGHGFNTCYRLIVFMMTNRGIYETIKYHDSHNNIVKL